jgi:hypothetical protein
MLATLSDPIILLILALLLTQSLAYLLGSLRAIRQGSLSKRAEERTQRELVEWGLLDAQQPTLTSERKAVLRAWARLIAQGRVGMGAGILLAVALVLALLSIPGSANLLGSSVPSLLLLTLLLLQAFYLGMFAGQAVGLAFLSPAGKMPALQAPPPSAGRRRYRGPARVGAANPAPADGDADATPQPRKLSEYRSRQVALLPGGLLAGDVLLLGLLDLLTLPGLPPAEVWSLIILPAVMALVCVGGEYAARRIARRPALPLSSDPTLARLADGKLRAHLIGLLLELEVFGLFILVGSQWMLRAFAFPYASSGLSTGALLVYGVILISLRGLLDRAQRGRGL